jgi:H+/gluconate symporter-like permease
MAHNVHGESTEGRESGNPKSSSDKKSMSDDLFNKIIDYVQGGIATFVAFLFLLITLGAIFGALVVTRSGGLSGIAPILLITPALLGFVAYYNRDFAVAIFALLFLFFIFL